MKALCDRLVIVLLLSATLAGSAPAQDDTWSGTRVVEGTVVVPAGVVLRIEPGTVVMMKDAAAIRVYGQLLADGNETQPIRFTRYTTGAKWKQIMFVDAADSRFAHCTFEYANSAGAHQDYYVAGPRNYHEAVVLLASHADFEGCTFQKLPDESSSAEGDALAIISDDPNHPGAASATFKGCKFLGIGQGIHTRFSYVLVEDCYFQGKHGDNDDIDLWGESTPPPMIRNNLFDLPEHDDRINPTRCSAIITGNVIMGSDDHGLVLRDKGSPIVMNNIIRNCSSGGIAVENSCTAFLANNTIVGCGRGIRLFDLGRWDSPYFLNPGGGTATVVNCIIWDCTQSITLADSSNTQIADRGSHVTISYCDIKGGHNSVSVSGTKSTVAWGPGNIDVDPLFADAANRNYHLKSQPGRWNPTLQGWVKDTVTSPCIDAGDPDSDWTAELWPHGGRINMGAYGGTPQAGMSANSKKGNAADVDYDGSVGLLDFAHLVQRWMVQDVLLVEDLDRNGVVNYSDLLLMAKQWLWQESN